MYVCICMKINEQQIHRAIAAGADTLAEIQRTLPVAKQCGRCIEQVCQILLDNPTSVPTAT
jgi:bacterioferritin-associated ferredoxin